MNWPTYLEATHRVRWCRHREGVGIHLSEGHAIRYFAKFTSDAEYAALGNYQGAR